MQVLGNELSQIIQVAFGFGFRNDSSRFSERLHDRNIPAAALNLY